jgi:hypothetical protein
VVADKRSCVLICLCLEARGSTLCKNRLTALRDRPPDDDTVGLVIGQSFVAAERTLIPSGPSIILILGLTAGAALRVGIWLALWLAPRRQPRLDKLAIVGDRAGIARPRVAVATKESDIAVWTIGVR